MYSLNESGQHFGNLSFAPKQIGRQHGRSAGQRPGDYASLPACCNVRPTRQPQGEARRNHHHHQLERGDALGNQWFPVRTAQHPFNLTCVAFARLRVTQHQGELQQVIHRDALVLEQVMPGRYSYHQRVIPYRFGCDAFADFIRLRKAYVVQIVLQPFDLLRQRYLEQTNIDLGLFLPAHC
ncbi:hypothetical protein WK35_24020 [Burkholderia vietnamiensis]|nr:hypothetical protein WK35_24020 [Burkholderia vietnamiensis]